MTRDHVKALRENVDCDQPTVDLDLLRALLEEREELVCQVEFLTKAGDRAQAAELAAKRKVIRLEAEVDGVADHVAAYFSNEQIGQMIAALPVTPPPHGWQERVLASIDAQELAALQWFHAEVRTTLEVLDPSEGLERGLIVSRIRALFNDPRMRAVLSTPKGDPK